MTRPRYGAALDFDIAIEEVGSTLTHAHARDRTKRHSRANRNVPAEDRPFIGWDGEGINIDGPDKPQHYVLFGNSTGEYIMSPDLKTWEILDFIVAEGKKHPTAIHVGFAFGYDSNMIIRHLGTHELNKLARNGYVKFSRGGQKYGIMWRPRKWFSVTKYEAGYNRKTNPSAKTTVRIYDIFGFFVCSWKDAVKKMLNREVGSLTAAGKDRRGKWTWDDMPEVLEYWKDEIGLFPEVAEELRSRLYGAGLRITQWYGPGALASFELKRRGIKTHMHQAPDAVRKAARYAYAGGRFELFKVGRVPGPIYSIDINSAYPYAISQLPSLDGGEWVYVENPKRIARFGVYHIRMNQRKALAKEPAPLFHRDTKHNISYPWTVEGWYWSPEAHLVIGKSNVEIVGGWELLHDTESKPFDWVPDVYDTRKEWKAAKNANEYALKLLLNSLYGKMAQRVGYDPKTGRIPPYHQIEWAGWVTSYTRAMLYAVISRVDWKDLIAVETDGIYMLTDPATLGITESKELGGWGIDVYDEMIYLQSGLAWLRQGDEWTPKRRGLDEDTFKLDDAQNYVRSLDADNWPSFVGKQTRFIGLKSAEMMKGPTRRYHCVWNTSTKEITPGENGKRFHMGGRFCRACREGQNAYDMPHDLLIRSLSTVGEMSTAHSIPWEGKDDANESTWRAHSDASAELYAE